MKTMDAATLEQALRDPAAVFATPEEVETHGGLSDAQRIEILRRWEYDASEDSVATEEGMPGGEDDLTARIFQALDRLGGVDPEKTSPTKHHGLTRGAVKRE